MLTKARAEERQACISMVARSPKGSTARWSRFDERGIELLRVKLDGIIVALQLDAAILVLLLTDL